MNQEKSTVFLPNILIPKNTDASFMHAWSVIACDQFTSDRSYWNELDGEIGENPSTLRLVFPEVFLKDPDGEKRVENINRNMRAYLEKGLFRRLDKGFVLTERTTRFTSEKRYGVVLAIDLEEYSFAPKSSAAIRATEATVPERIPPRVKIRQEAKLELPHVMLLYNAYESQILGEIEREIPALEKLYDFELNQGGGHLKGWFLNEEKSKEIINKLYRTSGEMLFAVGDGNHSLATAKTCWENIKKSLSEEEQKTHPARFALCEAVSIYSKALTFEPIYRYISGVDAEKFITKLEKRNTFKMIREGNTLSLQGEYDVAEALRALDGFIAEYLKDNGGEVDYIHGEKELVSLVQAGNDRVGVLLKAIAKDGFFRAVEQGGSLPRKTFSMGEGAEKRYYTECKEI